MRSTLRFGVGAAATVAAITALTACSSTASGSSGNGGNAGASASVSASVSASPPVTSAPSFSASVSASAAAPSATLASGHCVLYPRTQAAALIGTPNVTTGLPQITASGGAKVDSCVYGNVNVGSRSGKLLGYGAVKFSNNAAAAAAANSALKHAESEASNNPRAFPAAGLPSGTHDGVWKTNGSNGIPSITVAAVVTYSGKYMLWSEGGGTVGNKRSEQIALTVAKALASQAGH